MNGVHSVASLEPYGWEFFRVQVDPKSSLFDDGDVVKVHVRRLAVSGDPGVFLAEVVAVVTELRQ